MFPKLNQNLNSLSTQNLNQYQPSQNFTPVRNYQILSSILNHSNNSYLINNNSNNNSNKNIFSRQLNDSRYSSSKWILNKIDQNTSRITNNYKKEFSPLIQAKSDRNSFEIQQIQHQSLELEQQSNNTRRRRRINIKQIFSLDQSDNSNVLQDSQMSDQQPRQQILDSPTFHAISESPLKQRKVNRNMLYIQTNKSQDTEDQQDSEKFSCEKQQNRSRQSIRPRHGSLQGLFMDQRMNINNNNESVDQIINKSSIQTGMSKQPSYTSFFQSRSSNNKTNQTSIQIIESEKDNDDSQLSTNETEESMYNFKQQNHKVIIPITQKGILKNSSENYIKSPFKKQTKKQVSFNIIKKIF
ncbi:hypothetical protein ABPG74_008101 [Tetrahymena malaccensis]